MITALLNLAAILVPLVIGAAPNLDVKCGGAGCTSTEHPERLLPEDERAAVAASPEAARRLAAYTARPMIRLGLGAIALAEAVPFILLMLCVAGAMRQLGAGGDNDLAGALPWLKRASIAALVLAIVPPVTDSLRAMLLFPGTPSGPSWYLMIDFGRFGTGLLLAFAAFVVSWALAAGSRARAEISEFV